MGIDGANRGTLCVTVRIDDAQLRDGKTVGRGTDTQFIPPTDDISVGVWWPHGCYDNLTVQKEFFVGNTEKTSMKSMKEGAGPGEPVKGGRRWRLFGENPLSKPVEDFDKEDWEKVRELWLKKWYQRAKEYADKYNGEQPVLYCLKFP